MHSTPLYGLAIVSVFAVCGCEAPPAPPSPPRAVATLTPPVAAAVDDLPLDASVAAEESAASSSSSANQGIDLRPMNWTEVEALIRQHAGKIVVVDVWSTSCEPCLREFPHLVAMQQRYGDQVVCIGLNCDYVGIKKKPPESYREKVTKALAQLDAKIVNVLCTMPSDDLFAALKIDSIPAVFVYGRDSQRTHTFDNRTPAGEGEGVSYHKQVEPAVAALVEK